MNIVRFFFYNFVTHENKDAQIRHLKEEVENLNNVLEEVVKYLNRNRNNYDEEKAEFVDETEEEKEVQEKPDEAPQADDEKKIN